MAEGDLHLSHYMILYPCWKKYQKAEKLGLGERQESCLDLSPTATTSPVGMAKAGNGPNLHFILQKKVAHLTVLCLPYEKIFQKLFG